jgi:glutamyl-tRNA reductase
MDRFGLIGISHRRASVEEIGRFTRGLGDLTEMREALGVDELVCLNTCNRVELYWVSKVRRAADEVLRDFARWLFADDPEARRLACSACYALSGEAVVKHLYSVLSGLDSLVLGDEQIVGQFRRALVAARESRTCGPCLGLLGDEALKASRKVRAVIDFSKRPTSIAEVAAQQLKSFHRACERLRVVLVGSGEMIRTTAARLKGWKDVDLLFVNRTLSSAQALAEVHGGRAQGLADFQAAPADFDALVAATGADEPVVTAAQLAALPAPARPRLLLDLGVPADIEPALGEHPDHERFDVMELGNQAEAGRREAELLVREARPVLRRAIAQLREKLFQKDLGPVAQQLRQSVDARAEAELRRFLDGPLAHLAEEDRVVVEQLAARLAAQTVQVPLSAMRKSLRDLPLGDEVLLNLRLDAESEHNLFA